MIEIVYFFLVFVVISGLAQESFRVKLKGRTTFEFSALEGITALNLKSQQVAVSDKLENFSIVARVGDSLLFAEGQFKDIKIGVTQKDFETEIRTVQMALKVNELKEVVVKNDINAVSMRIIPKRQKTDTPAERKLYTATDLNASANVGSMMGGSVSADPLLNWISGRTKMLKKELEVEKKESYLRQLENWFTSDYFVNKLKIPAEYIKGFQYYSIEKEPLVAVLKTKNTAMTTFLVGELA